MLLEFHVRVDLSRQRGHVALAKHSLQRFELVLFMRAFPWTTEDEVAAHADQDEENTVDHNVADEDSHFWPVEFGDRAVSNFHGFQGGENLPLASLQGLDLQVMNDPADDEEDDGHGFKDDDPNCHVLANALRLLFWNDQE